MLNSVRRIAPAKRSERGACGESRSSCSPTTGLWLGCCSLAAIEAACLRSEFAKQRQYRRFLSLHVLGFDLDRLGINAREGSVLIRLDHGWVDVILFASRRAVAQFFRYPFHHIHYASLCFGWRSGWATFVKEARGETSAVPCSKILSCKIGLQDLAQVIIHISRMDAAAGSLIVDVLKQLVAGNALALPHDPGEPRILQSNIMDLATLTAKVKAQFPAKNRNVPVLQRR